MADAGLSVLLAEAAYVLAEKGRVSIKLEGQPEIVLEGEEAREAIEAISHLPDPKNGKTRAHHSATAPDLIV
jgi:hypothetical protein